MGEQQGGYLGELGELKELVNALVVLPGTTRDVVESSAKLGRPVLA
jgi:hypothetical protein